MIAKKIGEIQLFKTLGNLANMGSLLKQAQQMSGRLQRVTEELKGQRASGTSGGGLVNVEVNGLGEVLACRIDPSLLKASEKEFLEDLMPAAINQAQAKAKELHVKAMKSMTEGLDVPGLSEMLAQVSDSKDDPSTEA